MTKKTQTRKNSNKQKIPPALGNSPFTSEEREQMISEAAYYRAQQRGFYPEEHEQDWLEAEKIVDSMINRGLRELSEVTN